MKIIGFRHLSGTSKKTGKPYDAYTAYCMYQDTTDKQLIGYQTKELWVPSDLWMSSGAQMGCEVRPIYNERGFLVDLEVSVQSDG